MHAIPNYIPAKEVDPSGSYKCPMCNVQSTGDDADTGWVSCPLVGGDMICLGSCIDYQSVARSDDFDNHLYKDLFDGLAQKTGQDLKFLRNKCMLHQLHVIEGQISDGSEDKYELKQLALSIKRELGNEK